MKLNKREAARVRAALYIAAEWEDSLRDANVGCNDGERQKAIKRRDHYQKLLEILNARFLKCWPEFTESERQKEERDGK